MEFFRGRNITVNRTELHLENVYIMLEEGVGGLYRSLTFIY